jgi:hypothetical protein
LPTATQNEELTHDTELRLLLPVPGLGLATTTTESATAPAGVETTTPPNTIAITANIARTGLRTIGELPT